MGGSGGRGCAPPEHCMCIVSGLLSPHRLKVEPLGTIFKLSCAKNMHMRRHCWRLEPCTCCLSVFGSMWGHLTLDPLAQAQSDRTFNTTLLSQNNFTPAVVFFNKLAGPSLNCKRSTRGPGKAHQLRTFRLTQLEPKWLRQYERKKRPGSTKGRNRKRKEESEIWL